MSDRCDYRTVTRISVYCPVEPSTLAALARGELAALAADPVGGAILRFIETCPDLGQFGEYRGVCEVSIGLEAFTPGGGARPTLGAAGERSHSATAVITTYARDGLPPAELDAILAELCARHPWEVPVIELAPVTLVRRAAGVAAR